MKKIPNTELASLAHDPIDKLNSKEALEIMLNSHVSGLNIINNKQNFSINIDNTLFYIPRKFIDLDFYYKDPSFEVFERYLNYSNFSAIKYKQPTFYVGGGYGLMANRKIIESLNGHTEVNIPGSANDLDFNTRIKKMGLDQVDCSSFGINFFNWVRVNTIKYS